MSLHKGIATRPRVLAISGSDSSGCAGMQMDVKVCSALGAHALSAVTATTAQSSQTFYSSNKTPNDALHSQLLSTLELSVDAIKIGMLLDTEQINLISETLRSRRSIPIVIDPVMVTTSGKTLWSNEMQDAFSRSLLPLATLITPNIPEAELLSGISIKNKQDIEQAAKIIASLGCAAVLVKGGHFDRQNASYIQDYFYSNTRSFWLSTPLVNQANTRGTGCALSSSIASALASSYSIYDAVVIGKMTIQQGLRQAYALKQGRENQHGPILITHFPNNYEDLPYLSLEAGISTDLPIFPECTKQGSLGLYPVIDRASWLERLLPLGINTAQVRIKDLEGDALKKELCAAIALGKQHQCRLFINDYWELAIELGAYGVHLGQEDLDEADIEAIRGAGLRLGTSTHCHYEVARAHAYRPSYIAIGPVYPTTTKDMPWIPHGLEGFEYWQATLDYPLVAIGGINAERIPAIKQLKASGIAMITAITLAENPEQSTQHFMAMIDD